MEILSVKGLSFRYPHSEKRALEDISFSVEKGDFIVICGATGCGKSTLLRCIKPELAPNGEKSGKICFFGDEKLSERTSASKIGFVAQRPQQQVVTDRVWHELAFGAENIGIAPDEIRRRTAETASYLGIEEIFDKKTEELSGGQLQLLNLASILVMQPEILILDEPTAQLDPIAASEFIDTLAKLNRDFSLTIIIAEHRLEGLIPICGKILALESGSLSEYGAVRQTITRLKKHSEIICGMPASVRLWAELDGKGECPLNVSEGRRFIESSFNNRLRRLPESEHRQGTEKALEFINLYFRYSRSMPDALHSLNLTVYTGEIFCILGGNGSGKTTALETAAGLNKPFCGTVKVFGKPLGSYKNNSLYNHCLTLLPQDVQTLFVSDSVRGELNASDITSLPFDISPLLDRHPYDLSGGEQQLAALAKVLGTKPRLLLLDEPTKGLDRLSASRIAEILKELRKNGVTIVIVTHDTAFAAECADRCALFFRGEAVSCDTPEKFFSSSFFYTTAASRMSRGFYDEAVTVNDVKRLCMKNSEVGYADN